MKKGFKYYFITWLIMFALFNAVVGLLPKEFTVMGVTYQKLGGLSWVTLIVVEFCFLLHLVLTAVALNRKKLSGTFYRLRLIRISYGCLILTLIVALLGMAVAPNSWMPLVAALIILAFYVFALLRTGAAIGVVEGIDQKVQSQAAFVRTLTADAESLMARTRSPEAKAACRKVYEAVRYADPMSDPAVAGLEQQIQTSFTRFYDAVIADDQEAVSALSAEILARMEARNSRIRTLK